MMHPGIDTALTHTTTPHLAMRAKCVQSAPNPKECVTGYRSSRAPGRAHGAARACGPILQCIVFCVTIYYVIRAINVIIIENIKVIVLKNTKSIKNKFSIKLKLVLNTCGLCALDSPNGLL